MNCFNYADDFSIFTTEAHIIYLALNILEMNDINSDPGTPIPRGIQKSRSNYMNILCKTIIDTIWLRKSQCDVIDTIWLGQSQCHVDEVIEVKNNQIDKWCFYNDDGNIGVFM